jgi:predicted nucleic acid binding AN1-type Zn finger protein
MPQTLEIGKCGKCKGKLKVINFPCKKCKGTFCTKCRFPEVHDCDYDYKKDRVLLEKIVADKIERI